MACYDFNYTVQLLRHAVDFAEIEHDFAPLRKLVNEVRNPATKQKPSKPG